MTVQACITGANKVKSYNGDYRKRGDEAEEVVLEFLRNNPEYLDVDDWSDLKAVQKADVDCAITTKDGHVILAEIKNDSYLGVTGNVLFEVLRIYHKSDPDRSVGLGWSGKTPAKYIFYYAPNDNNRIYRFKTETLRKAMQDYTNSIRKKKNGRINISQVFTDETKTTINILIPISFFSRDSYEIYETEDIPF